MDTATRQELAALRERREAALDRFVNSFVELCNIEYRFDVLLDRSLDREKAPA